MLVIIPIHMTKFDKSVHLEQMNKIIHRSYIQSLKKNIVKLSVLFICCCLMIVLKLSGFPQHTFIVSQFLRVRILGTA